MLSKFKDKLFSDKFTLYQQEIDRRNRKSFNAFASVTMAISVMVWLSGFLLYDVATFKTEYFVMFCYSVLMFLVSKTYLKRYPTHILPVYYAALSPLMFLGILMGTFLDPGEPSITIMVFLCVLPLFMLDRIWRVFVFITAFAILYTICCFFAKEHAIFIADMVDLIAFYILGVGINYFVLNDRIDSVENFMKFRSKSEIDPLTGLYNRGTGVEKIEALIDQQVFGAFIIMDVDNFKDINDGYGHLCGDGVLQKMATIITSTFSPEDICLRMGGDEFAVFVRGLTDEERCEKRLRDLSKRCSAMKVPGAPDFVFSISAGCALYHDIGTSFATLYKNGDEALYFVKRNGRGNFKIYS